MSRIGFEAFVLAWVCLMLAILLVGWWRGGVERKQGHLFSGMFLAMLPMVAGNLLDDVGLSGPELTVARVGLLLVGVLGAGLALRGHRMTEADGGDDRTETDPPG